MRYIAIAVFALAAISAIAILIKWLNKEDATGGIVYSHRIFPATALQALIAKTILVTCMIAGNYIGGSLILKYKIGVQESYE